MHILDTADIGLVRLLIRSPFCSVLVPASNSDATSVDIRVAVRNLGLHEGLDTS